MKKLLPLLSFFLISCSFIHVPPDKGVKLVPPDKEPIIITTPQPNESITSPLTISGQARGYWFFEATAPLLVVDWDGRIIGESYIQATDEWMTEDFVPFTGTIEFDVPEDIPYRRGAIIVQRNNPSDLPKNDAAVEIPVKFQ